MRAFIFLIALSFASGCAPSTMLINARGETRYCSFSNYDYGIGFSSMAMGAVGHYSCVEDKEKLGYVKIPEGELGVRFDPSSSPLTVTAVSGAAAKAGIQPKDILLTVEDVPVANLAEVYKVLNKKASGEPIKLKMRRGDSELEFRTLIIPSR